MNAFFGGFYNEKMHLQRKNRKLFEESMVREGRLELPHLTAPDPKSGVSTNSTTLAKGEVNAE